MGRDAYAQPPASGSHVAIRHSPLAPHTRSSGRCTHSPDASQSSAVQAMPSSGHAHSTGGRGVSVWRFGGVMSQPQTAKTATTTHVDPSPVRVTAGAYTGPGTAVDAPEPMARLADALELKNLRLLFDFTRTASDVAQALRQDASFAHILARTLGPWARADRGGPISIGDPFPPRRPFRVPALEGRRIGLVASGGSGATAALCGVRRAFEEAGLEVTVISACSGSLLFAGLWAAGLDADAMARFWLERPGRDTIDPQWSAVVRGLLLRAGRGLGGILRGQAIEDTLAQALPGLTLGRLRVPLSAVVWNIDLNRVEHLGTTTAPDLPLARLVRVALSIPILVEPVQIGEHLYGDGGIVDIFPIAPMLGDPPPCDVVLGINSYYPPDFVGEDVSGWYQRTWSILRASRQLRDAVHLELAREHVRELGDRLCLLQPVPVSEIDGARFYQTFLDRADWPRYMRMGHAAARAALEQWPPPRRHSAAVPVARRDEPMSAVDAAWLRMDHPTTLMTITALLVLDGAVDLDRLRLLLQERLLAFPRFRQRVVEPRWALGAPRWQRDPDFDLDAHVHPVALVAPWGTAALQGLVGELMSTPFDPERPLWQLHVVEGLEGRTAIIARVHHAVADGIALVRVLRSLAEPAEGARPARPFGAAPTAAPSVSGLVDLGRLAVMGRDPVTSLKQPLGVVKRAAWSEALPLARLRAAAHARNATVNDVLMAAIAGALRRLLEARAEVPADLTVRAVVPVDLRGGADLELGNRFGLVFVELPVGVADRAQRFSRVQRATNAVKRSPEAVATYELLEVVGHAGAAVEEAMVDLFGTKASLVVTNVPGPKERLTLAGKTIESIMVWVPQSGRLGLGVSLLSYAGEVRIGVGADAGVVPDPGAFVADIVREVAALAPVVSSEERLRLH